MKHSSILKFGMIFFPCLQIVWTILWHFKIIIPLIWFVLLLTNIFLFFHYKSMYNKVKRFENYATNN